MTVLRPSLAALSAVLLLAGLAVGLGSPAAAFASPFDAFSFDHSANGQVDSSTSAFIDDSGTGSFEIQSGSASQLYLRATNTEDGLTLYLTAPSGSSLETGTVATTTDGSGTFLNVVSDRHGSCSNTGSVTIDDLQHDTSATYWTAVALSYSLSCDDGSTETGVLRYHDDQDFVARSVPQNAGDVGTRYTGTTVTQPVIFTNDGTSALTPQAALGSDPSGAYSVHDDGCSGASLAAGASCTVTLDVRITGTSPSTSTLTFTTGGGLLPLVVPLTATPIPPAVVQATPTAGHITLTWTETEHYGVLSYYRVLRGSSPSTLGLLTHTGGTTYTDSSSGGVLYYSVQAVSTDGRVGGATTPIAAETWPIGGAGAYQPIRPVRFLDTRNGTGVRRGAVTGGHSIGVTVSGIPRNTITGASAGEAAIVNLTAVGPTKRTFVTAYPYGTSRPSASSLNVDAGETRSNSVTVKLGSGQRISVYVDQGTVNLVADVVGYYLSDRGTPSFGIKGGLFHPEPTPVRIYDSRQFAPLPGEYYRTFNLGGYAPVIQQHLRAVVLTITAVDAISPGYLTVWDPDLSGVPATSTLTFRNRAPVPNLAVVQTQSRGGAVPHFAVLNGSNRAVQFVVDLLGYYDDDSFQYGSRFVPSDPIRIVDTRLHRGLSHALGPNQTGTLTPQSNTGANYWTSVLDLNVTAVSPTAQTYQTVWSALLSRPSSSSLNEVRGQNCATQVFSVTSGAHNLVSFYNRAGTVDMLADLEGRFDLYPYLITAQNNAVPAHVSAYRGSRTRTAGTFSRAG